MSTSDVLSVSAVVISLLGVGWQIFWSVYSHRKEMRRTKERIRTTVAFCAADPAKVCRPGHGRTRTTGEGEHIQRKRLRPEYPVGRTGAAVRSGKPAKMENSLSPLV